MLHNSYNPRNLLLLLSILRYNRGRRPRTDKWVFGMVDTSTQPSLGYMELVPDRTAQTLLPIIQAHTQSGTIVWSDERRAYRRVSTLSTVQCHQTVNHSVEFVSPQGGSYTGYRKLLAMCVCVVLINKRFFNNPCYLYT